MQTVITEQLIHYQEFGNSSKIPVLILHGWGHSSAMWKRVAEQLSKNHFVVTVDLPGFGKSAVPPQWFDTSNYAALVKAFIKKKGLSPVVLLGHSFGGKISVLLSQEKDISIKQVVLISPSGLEQTWQMKWFKVFMSRSKKLAQVFLPPQLLNAMGWKLRSKDYQQAGEMRTVFKQTIAQHVEKQAIKIDQPTTLIWGYKDNQLPVSQVKTWQRLVAHAQVRLIWSAGHNPHLTDVDYLTEVLDEVLHK